MHGNEPKIRLNNVAYADDLASLTQSASTINSLLKFANDLALKIFQSHPFRFKHATISPSMMKCWR